MRVGVIWYRSSEDYDRLKAMSEDGDELPDTFEEWHSEARKVVRELVGRGNIAVKSYLDPVAFPEWCQAHGLKVNTEARTRYSIVWAQKGGPP